MDVNTPINIPPVLLRRLRFRARRERCPVEAEIARCLERGLEAADHPPVRFRDRARELRHRTRVLLSCEELRSCVDEPTRP